MKKDYPPEAVGLGTIVRSIPLDRLGVVTDAYKDDRGVIFYNCFFIPHTSPGMYYRNLLNSAHSDEVHGIMIEESEFDLIFYLMIGKIDLEELDIFHVPGELVL